MYNKLYITIIVHILFKIVYRLVENEKEPSLADELEKLIDFKS